MDDEEGPVAGSERVQLRSTDGTELPLRVLVLGDLTGRPDPTLLENRPAIEIDKDNFAEVMRSVELRAELTVPNVLDGSGELAVSIPLRTLAGFSPEGIAQHVAPLRALRELRYGLTALKGPLGGIPRFRRRIQEALQDPHCRARLAAELGVAMDHGLLAREIAEWDAAPELARASTDPAVLARVAEDPRAAVRALVGRNVHIDEAVIAVLSNRRRWSASEELASNPVVQRLVRARPAILATSPWLGNVLHWHLPWSDEIAVYTAADPELTVAHRMFAYVATEMPLDLGEVAVPAPRRAMDRVERLARWNLTSGAYDIALQQAPRSELEALLARRAALAREPLADALRHVASHYPWLWRAVASHAQCPDDVLTTLANAPVSAVREAALRGADAPPPPWHRSYPLVGEALARLAAHPPPERGCTSDVRPPDAVPWWRRLFAARWTGLSACLEPEELARDAASFEGSFDRARSPSTRVLPRYAWSHPALPGEILSALVASEWQPHFKLLGAIHPNAPRALLEQLAADKCPPVRGAARDRLLAAGC